MTEAPIVQQEGVVGDDGGVSTSETGPSTARSGRFDEFEQEVASIKTRAGGGERRLLSLSGLAVFAGFVLIVIAWYQMSGVAPSEGSGGLNKQLNYLVSYGFSGLGLIILGGAMFVRYSLGQYLRYWIARQVAEQQAQTDRVVDALDRVERALEGRGPSSS